MNTFASRLQKCVVDGEMDLKLLIELVNLNFKNLSLDSLKYIESECFDARQKMAEAEKVACYKTNRLQSLGFNDIAYFAADELDTVKALATRKIEQGDFGFDIKLTKISKDELAGHIRDRKEWERDR